MTYAVLVVFVCINTVPSAFASALDLSIFPSLLQITAAPGSSAHAPITLTNHTENPLQVTFRFLPFKTAADGSIRFGHENELSQQAWLRVEKNGHALERTFELRPQESGQLTLTIDVPKEALPSDHYITVLFEAQSKNPSNGGDDQTVSIIQAGVGAHILLAVSATPLPSFSAQLKAFASQWLSLGEPIAFRLLVENQGPHFAMAKGNIEIYDRKGQSIKTIPIPPQIILAGSTKDLASDIPAFLPAHLFGTYSARALVDLGEGSKLTQEITFYVLPKWTAIIVFTTLLLLASISRKFHLYAKWKQTPPLAGHFSKRQRR